MLLVHLWIFPRSELLNKVSFGGEKGELGWTPEQGEVKTSWDGLASALNRGEERNLEGLLLISSFRGAMV